MIAVDIETHDPNLKTKGTGVYRKDGYILGIAIATSPTDTRYYDIGHEGTSEEQRKANMREAQRILRTDEDKIGTNLLYDLDWLINGYGYTIGGKWHDICIAEALIDEYRPSYSLDSLAQKYLGEHKGNDEITAWCEARGLKGDPRQHLALVPAELVGKYAQSDVRQPLLIWEKQKEILDREMLTGVYDVEIGLLPMLLRMKQAGIRVDEKKRLDSLYALEYERAQLYSLLTLKFGHDFNFNSSAQLARILTNRGYTVAETEKGNPSVRNEDLETLAINDPLMHKLVQLRKIDKVIGTFINGAYVEHQVDGRIHPTFVPVAHGDSGTVSGRLACKTPNLQQAPGKDGDKEKGDVPLGSLCRNLFIPEEGHWLGSSDLSQIEFRMLVHYAQGPKAKEARDAWCENPKQDYHKMVAAWTELERSEAKRVTFGVAFGMGKDKMQKHYGWSEEHCLDILSRYHAALPFVKYTQNMVSWTAMTRGYIKTLAGRRARMTQEMKDKGKGYVFFNRLQQGSAADYNKVFMFKAWKAGVFNELVPHLTIHDEIVVSVPKTYAGVEAFFEMHHIMETAIPLRVPVISNPEIGHTWGSTQGVATAEDVWKI